MAGIERGFLRFALGVSAVAWLAVVLAEFGRFGIEALAALAALGALGAGLFAFAVSAPRRRGPGSAPGGGGWRAPAEFGVLLALCAAAFSPPHEAVLAGGDATVYLNFGSRIAATGALEFEDALVGDLPADLRAALFENRLRALDATGRYARFPGGFQIPAIGEPTVTAGFSPLFPVVTAAFHDAFSLRGSLFVAPTFAILSIGALFLVAAHLGGRRVGWLTAVLTVAALPQLWFARLPVPEMAAQCFVLAGLLAWLVACRDGARGWAAAAGWFFGVACFAKVDLIVLLSVSLLAFGAWRWLVRPDRAIRGLGWLLMAFVPLLIHNVAHYLTFASHYRPYVEYLVERSWLAARLPADLPGTLVLTAGAAVAAGLAWAAYRCAPPVRRRACGLAAAGVLAAYAVNYAGTTTARLDETVVWLSWYVSWPVLALAALGLVRSIARGGEVRAAGGDGSALAVVLLAVVGLHYLYDPLEPGVHIWSMRRFVPVVLPLTMLMASMTAAALAGRIAAAWRPAVAAGSAVVLVALVARPTLAVAAKPVWTGAIAQSAAVAGQFPPGAVVLAAPRLAGAHLPTSLAYLHGVDALLFPAGLGGDRMDSPVARAVHFWLARGRPVFFVFTDRDHFSFFAPEFSLTGLGHTQIDLPMLERTEARAPRAVVRTPIRLRVFQVRRRHPVRTAVDIGDPRDDVFFGLDGFHTAERDGRGDGTFRWTGARASLTIPGGTNAALTVGAGRPAGAPPAEIRAWLDGGPVAARRLPDNEPQVIVVEAPPGSEPARLTIESGTFQPLALDISADSRHLGVKLYSVAFDAPAAAGSDPRPDGQDDAVTHRRRPDPPHVQAG